MHNKNKFRINFLSLFVFLFFSGLIQATTYTFEDTNSQAIVDNACITVTTTVTLADDFTVTDLDVGIMINHTFRGDLDISIASPIGTTVDLLTDVDAGSDDLNVLLNSSSGAIIPIGDHNLGSGDYFNDSTPEVANALDAFNGENSVGDWILTVCDDAGGDEGNLQKSKLVFDDAPQPISSSIVTGSDDAEENVGSGGMDLGSSDLEMIEESSEQFVGMRFTGINIPIGATIINASIDFVADESDTVQSDLVFFGEDSGNASTFTNSNSNISDRASTTATVPWSNVPSWTSGTTYTTPDLTIIVQEVINRGDWASDSIVIMVSGTSGSVRVAESFDKGGGTPAVLNIEYSLITPTMDYGDAPDLGNGTGVGDYQTILSDNGPSHVPSTNLFLGNLVADVDYNGLPSDSANGDDDNGTADEDSPQNLIFSPGDTPEVRILATNETGFAATLSGWIDLNVNGVFETATEGATVIVPDGTVSTLVTLNFPIVPSGLPSTTYMRLRLSTDNAALVATGAASDGEVEDHRVFINGDATTSVQQCYAVADSGNWLVTADPISAETDDDVNEGLGAAGFSSLEAMVWDLGDPLITGDEVLYGADVNDLVRLLPLPRAVIGTFDQGVSDSDGLAIDWQSVPPVFYGSGNTGNGHLNIFIYDVTDASVATVSNDITLPTLNTQIDDIAWDPINRRLLAVTNDGSDLSHLVEFDLSNFPGNTTIPPASDCGSIKYFNGSTNEILLDTEGLSFTRPGELFIVTGNEDDDGSGPQGTANSLWKVPVNSILSDCSAGTADIIAERIGPQNALATVPSGTSVGDYEAVGCGNTFSTSNASLGNRVWLDEDGDGEQDAGEDGIGGVTVYLCQAPASPCNFASAIRTEITDANGGYLFTAVPILDYVVAIDTDTVPSNLVSNPTYDEDDGTISPDHETLVSLTKIEEEYLTADFGYNWNNSPETETPPPGTTGSIGDRIWIDADANGVQDSDEAGINSVTVTIYTDPDGDSIFDNLVATSTTDANGNYVFDGLVSGAYVVEVDTATLPAGITWTQTGDPDDFAQIASDPDNKTTAPIILAPGDVFVNADFGYQGDGSNTHTLGDTVFLDADADGVEDIGEPGIAGVTVTLLDVSGNPIAQDLTDSDGHYSFPGLPDGAYTVAVTDTNNILGPLNQSADPDAILDSKSTVTLAGSDNLNQDFGYKPKGHGTSEGLIGDTIFIDIDGNGTQVAGEPGIEGVIVELIDTSSGIVQQRVTTDENGNYYFGNLSDDTYTVRVDTTTLPNAGAGMTNTADPDAGFDDEADTTIAGANIDLDQDFGYQVIAPNTLGGTLWNDNDADGTQDGGETVEFANVTVNLLDTNGNVVGVTTTDNSGHYEFTGLPDGTYTVSVTDDSNVLAGHWLTEGSNPGVDLNSQVVNYSISLAGGQNNQTGDFGYYVNLASIGNIVFRDDNNDGLRDSLTEPGIPLVPVTLTITYPNTDTVTLTTLTDGAGYYSFANLLADDSYTGDVNDNPSQPTYSIAVGTVATGFMSTYDGTPDTAGIGNGLDDNSDNEQGEAAFPVKGSQDLSNDFGYVPGGSIGNRVWLDLDNDGIQDANEDGIANRIVSLTPPAGVDLGAGDGVAITTVTDSEGKYIFANIPLANNYSVTVTNPPAGLTQTFDEDGTGTAHTSVVNLTMANEEHLTADFGYNAPSGSIGDYVWADANGDGQQDPNEIGLNNVTVYLCTATNSNPCNAASIGVITTTTDATGHYIYTGLNVTETNVVQIDTTTLPVGYAQTGDPDGTFDNQTTVPALNTSNGINLDADFGYQPLAANHFDIGDTVYQDLDNDGVEDGTEPGIPGVTVQLFVDTTANGIADTPVASTITDSDGQYLFPALPGAVAYSVLVTDTNNILNGLVQTGDPDGVLDNQSTINPLNVDNLDQDFGYRPLRTGNGIIGDRIFNDVDNSGTQNIGDQGLEDVTVRLFDTAGNLINSIATDENGQYLFTGLDTSATYTVNVITSTLPNNGVGWSNNVDPDGGNNSTSSVDLSLGSGINLDQDFGYVTAIIHSIEGTIWVDTDGDGLLDDPDELPNGIENVTMVLNDNTRSIVATTTTDANGDYSFTGLAAGTYRVSVTDEFNELANLQHTDGPNANDNTIDNNSQDDTGYAVSVGGVFPILNTTADFGYKPVVTTPITLASFKTSYNQATGETILKWSTLTETGNIGFDVYRQVDGMWVQVNPVTIASKAVYSTKLVTYEYTYKGEYTREWALVDIDIKGRRQSHGVYEINKLYGVEDSIESLQSTHWDNIKQQHEGKVEERKQQKASAINDYIRSQQNKTLQSKGAGS